LKEASFLYLNCDKAFQELEWSSAFSFRETVRQTVAWYRGATDGRNVWDLTKSQIDAYAMSEAGMEVATR
jgi:dTDP-D-glucose 4,6-dehydratase